MADVGRKKLLGLDLDNAPDTKKIPNFQWYHFYCGHNIPIMMVKINKNSICHG